MEFWLHRFSSWTFNNIVYILQTNQIDSSVATRGGLQIMKISTLLDLIRKREGMRRAFVLRR